MADNKTFVGIDPGLIYPSLAVKIGRRFKLHTIDNYHHDFDKTSMPYWKFDLLRLHRIGVSMSLAFRKIPGVKVIGLERVAHGATYQVAMMGKVEHVILEAIDRIPLVERVYIFTPGTWKKVAIGMGNASKEEVAEFLKSKYSNLPEGVRQDKLDALGICLATEIQYARDTKTE